MAAIPVRSLARALLVVACACGAGCQSFLVQKELSYDPALGSFGAFDRYTPTDPSQRPWPAVIAIHGGSWRHGDKSWGESVAEELCPEGYAVLSINYRLTTESTWPAQIEDVQAALRYFRASAAELQIDPERIAAFGVSAGAHLASMLLLRGPDRVRVAIGANGPYDFMNIRVTDPALEQLLGPEPTSEALRDTSPVAFARRDASLFLVHSQGDTRVSVEHATRLYAAMKAAGADVLQERVDGAGHGRTWRKRVPEILEFLESRLR